MSALKICPQCGTEYPANERFCPRDGTALRSQEPTADLVGSIIADRYHVLRKLGEGGMGQVYLAEHVKMGRKSAVKVMRPGMVKDVDAISRFNREAANASRINHPNIAGIYDFGETSEGIIYLAMEYIEGQALTAIIEQQGALVPARAAVVLLQTAEALGAAHDMGIVHRDLKPDNIMIAKNRDGSDCVKVVDFGIAKAAGSDAQKVTKTGLVVGTPEYMSPEQLAGDKLDGRSDIYSLGLVAFNMLTGFLPFPSESAQESMIMRLTDKPKSLAEMRPDIPWPADLQAVMDKALARDVTQRYQTAPEFGRDFYRMIERMPVTQAAQAGTQVIGSQPVPPTRVAGAAAGADRTVAMATPEVPATAVPFAAAKSKSRVPLYSGIVVLALIGATMAWKTMGGKSAAADTGSTTKPTATTTGATTANADSVKTPITQRDSGTKGAVPGASGTDPLAHNTKQTGGVAAAKSLEDRLTLLLTDSKKPNKAAAVTRQVDALEPQAKSSIEKYLVATLRANVLVDAQTDTVKACSVLSKALESLAPVEAGRVRDRMANALSCP